MTTIAITPETFNEIVEYMHYTGDTCWTANMLTPITLTRWAEQATYLCNHERPELDVIFATDEHERDTYNPDAIWLDGPAYTIWQSICTAWATIAEYQPQPSTQLALIA